MDEDNVEYNESVSVISMFNDCTNSFSNIWESETKTNVQTLGSAFITKKVAYNEHSLLGCISLFAHKIYHFKSKVDS